MAIINSSRLELKKLDQQKQKRHDCLGCGKSIFGWVCDRCKARNRNLESGGLDDEERYEFHPEAIETLGEKFYE